jgi:pyruvate formate lyase activating enzyme
VVISGGEPTLAPELLPFLRQLKGLGLQVKLDTNGLLPSVLETALGEGLLDFIALDLKTAPDRYGELHPGPVAAAALTHSARLVMHGGTEYEFRTTCVPGLVNEADIRALGEVIRGARRWVLQQFVPGHALAEELHAVEPHSAEMIQAFARVAGEYVQEVGVRGVIRI